MVPLETGGCPWWGKRFNSFSLPGWACQSSVPVGAPLEPSPKLLLQPSHPSPGSSRDSAAPQMVPASPGSCWGHTGGVLWRIMESQGGKTLPTNPLCVSLAAMGWAKETLTVLALWLRCKRSPKARDGPWREAGGWGEQPGWL